MQHTSAEIANEFIKIAKSHGEHLTNMKVQKLVYCAQGYSMALDEPPMIDESVEAWQYGPVFRRLYYDLLQYGGGEVTNEIPVPKARVLTELQREIVNGVWHKYGHLSGIDLSALTHMDGTPWHKVFTEGVKKMIPSDSIKEHFEKLVTKTRKSNVSC